MSNPAAKPPRRSALVAAVVCAVAGVVLFQFFGNASHGYVKTWSLFWWWVSQWLDPAAETEHAWLIAALSLWLLWRNLRNPEYVRADFVQVKGAGAHLVEPMAPRVVAGAEDVAGAIVPSQIDERVAEPAPIAAADTCGRWGAAAPAFAALFGGLASHAVGFVAQQARLSIVAFLLFTWGVLRLGGGRRWGAASVFPLAFLAFAIPVNVLDSLGFWLRLWVVEAGSAFAGLSGIDVVQSGTQLFSADGRYNYDVAAACSGVRSLVALAALSLLIGYLNFKSWHRRVFLLLLCFPLVYVGNVIRISGIILAAEHGGPRWGDRAHDVMGYGVFIIVLGGVLGAASLLRRFAPEAHHAPRTNAPSPSTGELSGMSVALVFAVVALAAGEVALLRHLASQPMRGEAGVVLARDGVNPVELPTFLRSEWVGWPAPVTAVERSILPPDTGYSRMEYVATRGGGRVFLSLVLSGRDRTSIHRPELCLLGQGWTITGQSQHVFRYPERAGASFRATVLRVNRERTTARGKVVVPQLVAYWFVGSNHVAATHWERVLRDGWTRLTRGRADRWAYVLMQTDAADGETAALDRMQKVLDRTLPAFQKPSASGG